MVRSSRGLRIALVYRSLHLAGSLPRMTVELARRLSDRHDVHVFSIESRTDRSLAPDCTFHAVPVAALGDGRRFSARELSSFARNAAALLARENFDITYTVAPSTWVSDVLCVPGVAREEARLQGIGDLRYAAAGVRHPGDLVRRWLERKALAHPGLRRIHAQAESVKAALSKRYGVDPDDVLVVTPRVDLDEFRPPADKAAARVAAGIDPDTFAVMFCGSDFGRKGLDRAIEALAQVRAPAALVVVGSGQEEPFRRLAAECGVGDRVTFLGGRSDSWRYYQAADVLVLPTRADIWGVTPLEAMACGVPPIVSAAAGVSSAIRHDESGIVLQEPFDVRALSAAIEALAVDPGKREAMGRAGIQAVKHHDWETRGREIENDLLNVVQKKATSQLRTRTPQRS